MKKDFIFNDVNTLKGVGPQLSKYLKKKKIAKIKPIIKTSDKKTVNVGADEKPEIKKIKKQPTEKKIYNLKDYVVYPKHGVGKITAIEDGEKGKVNITAQKSDGETVTQTIPRGLKLCVKVSDVIKSDQPLTYDPNVGGFGQTETEIILQNPNRVKGMIAFFFTVTVAQILLVIKKKQFEKVQAAEMNF